MKESQTQVAPGFAPEYPQSHDSSTVKEAESRLVEDIHRVRSRVCNAMLMALSITVIPALINSLYRAIDIGWQPIMSYHILLAASVLTVTFMRHQIAYRYRAGFLLGFFMVTGLAGISQFGMLSASVLFLILAGPVVSLFFDGKLGIATFCLSQLLIAIFGYLFVSGTLLLNIDGNAYHVAASSWVTLFFGTLASGGVLAVGIYVINRYLMKSVRSARFHAKNLEKHQESLEQVIAERTHELKQSNEELERFAQIAAHDLRSPMSVISGHVELLEMTCKDVLDEKSKRRLDEIGTGIMQLSSMLNDLLMYARATGHADEFKETDMNEVLEIAKKHLSTEIAEYSVVVQSDELPNALVDEHQLIRVFQNLLSNCIRYRDKHRPLEIRVRAQRQEQKWVFSISDNGVGIAKDQFESIFKIYNKADNNWHPESSGIGLAVCQKIINRHNGRLWVESETGKGSTFFFAL